MAKNNVSRKQLVNALTAEGIADIIAATIDAPTADVMAAIDKMIEAANRPKVSKPSAETLRNREIAKELAAEVTARGKETTAAEIADYYTDPDGMTLNPRKVGALLRTAVSMGLIDVSPEPWSVKHYGPKGFAFAVKPKRERKAKTEETDASDSEQSDAQDVTEE